MGTRQRVLTVLGTRPEAIKLFPLLHALGAQSSLESRVCVTGQHGVMVDRVLDLAGIVPHHALSSLRPGQTAEDQTAALLRAIGQVLDAERPDRVIVQGDTATAFAAALCAHYRRIPVCHVEAGLRSGDPYRPWPEEFNRKAIAAIADLHCAPTETAAAALRGEGVGPAAIHVTGNTVIDALHWVKRRVHREPGLAARAGAIEARLAGRRIVAVTSHRRESLGDGVEAIAKALARLADRPDIGIVLPLHPNPAVRSAMAGRLAGRANVALTGPLDYPDFARLLDVATLVLTDSGGVQEEAPAFGTPVLVMRDTTERPEGVAAGTALLVGTDTDRIVGESERLLDDPVAYARMAQAHSPYGDGRSAQRIAGLLAA